MTLTVLRDPALWERSLRRVHGPKTLASFAYAQASTRLYGDGVWAEAAVLEEDGHVVFHPYVRRPIPQAPDLTDLVSAFEFGGFWCSADDPVLRADLLRSFARRFGEHAAKAGIVTEFVRLNPLLPSDGLEDGGYVVRHHQDHTIVPLDENIDAVRRRYSQSRGHQVRQGQRNGLALRRVEETATLCRLLHANLTRLDAKPFYFFPDEFLRDLLPFTAVFHVLDPEGTVIGAHMYVADGDILYIFLSGTDARHLPRRPNDFAYDAVIGWAIENGFRILHLGGGAEGLLHYKRSFGPDTVPYRQAKRVFLPAIDHKLAEGRGGTFFPAYRRPG